MNGDIKKSDFYTVLSSETKYGNASSVMAKRYMDALYRVILNELRLNGRVKVPNIGIFELVTVDAHARVNNFKRDGSIFWVDEYNAVEFKPLKRFKEDINKNEFEILRARKKESARKELKKAKDAKKKKEKLRQNSAEKNVALFFNEMAGV